MPSTSMLLPTGVDDLPLSPIQPSWVFDEMMNTPTEVPWHNDRENENHDTLDLQRMARGDSNNGGMNVVNGNDRSLVESYRVFQPSQEINEQNDPSNAEIGDGGVTSPRPTVLHRPIRYIPRFTRWRRQHQQQQQQPSLPGGGGPMPNDANSAGAGSGSGAGSVVAYWPPPHAQCFIDDQETAVEPPTPPITTLSCLPSSYYTLPFDIVNHDGGCYSSTYNIQNILRNDSSVYCSGRVGAVNIQFGYRGHGNAIDSSCVFTKIIVKSPQQGFTAPCKEGLVFISRKPIDIQKTRRFDGFTRADFDEYMKTINPTDVGDENPVAWFTIHHHKQAVVSINERSGKYVLIKLLRSEHEEDNIDIQYIGFIGYTGPRSFASLPQLL